MPGGPQAPLLWGIGELPPSTQQRCAFSFCSRQTASGTHPSRRRVGGDEANLSRCVGRNKTALTRDLEACLWLDITRGGATACR